MSPVCVCVCVSGPVTFELEVTFDLDICQGGSTSHYPGQV